MYSINPRAVFRYHEDMATLHGSASCFALGWRDTHSQLVRFGALARIAGLDNTSVLDAGCGHGDLSGFLNNQYKNVTYTGMEQIGGMINIAKKRYGTIARVNFLSGNFMTDVLPQHDYVMVSGALNYQNADPDFIYKAIDKLYSACKKGFAFNLLHKVKASGLIIAHDPEVIVAYCKGLSTKVSVIDDYSDEDFTVFMLKQ